MLAVIMEHPNKNVQKCEIVWVMWVELKIFSIMKQVVYCKASCLLWFFFNAIVMYLVLLLA